MLQHSKSVKHAQVQTTVNQHRKKKERIWFTSKIFRPWLCCNEYLLDMSTKGSMSELNTMFGKVYARITLGAFAGLLTLVCTDKHDAVSIDKSLF